MTSNTNAPFLMRAGCLVLLTTLAACGNAEVEPPREEPVVSVGVSTVERRALQSWLYGQGTVRSRQREFLSFTREGLVTFVDPNLRVGSPVKAGQLIAYQAPERLGADLRAGQATLAEAQANLEVAQSNLERYQTLIGQRSASQQELERADLQVKQAHAARDSANARVVQAQVSLDESRLVSPINGTLARLNIEKGRYFTPASVQAGNEQGALRTVPVVVIDPTRFEVRVDLPSYQFAEISRGTRAIVGGVPSPEGDDADPLAVDSGIEARVHAVSPSLDPDSRTFEVIIHTVGGRRSLQDGQFAAVWIAEPVAENTLAVPLQALRFRNDQFFLFVVDPRTGKVAERRVEVGQISGGYRAILTGLDEGAVIVTDGHAALSDGQVVRMLARDESTP